MPTPFSHLRITQRLLDDDAVPATQRTFLHDYISDFSLGGIVADQRPGPDAGRETTHFYHYTKPMPDNPWREMLRRFPTLETPQSNAHRAFLMGYVAHLAADEYWSRNMLGPHFANGTWTHDRIERFFVLHLVLIFMDERDETHLAAQSADVLRGCQPQGWLPFLPDDKIIEWRDFLAEQIEGESQTLEIFSTRLAIPPAAIRATLDDVQQMQRRVWGNITPKLLATIERDLYAFSRQQMLIYVDEFLS